MWRIWGLTLSVAVGMAACGDHDPEIDRVGGPLPNYDAGNGGDGGCQPPAASATGARIPCDVDAVLTAKCRRCHGVPTANGAPFSLSTWKDLNGDYGGEPIYVRMRAAVSSDFMPLCAEGKCGTFDPVVQALTAEEKSVLLDWLECPQPDFGGACSD